MELGDELLELGHQLLELGHQLLELGHQLLGLWVELMLHLYNKGGGGYPELMKLTGLSKFGLGKYIRSLKKRGWIERNGWQQFNVTAHDLNILKLARCEGA